MNKYECITSVGEGAYGVVIKCRNKESNEFVAIKKFKESEEDEAVRKTTLREVKILRMLKHDNIVQLIEAFRRKGKLYLVFEFVDRNLLEVLEGYPKGLEADYVRHLMRQLVRAVDYCHSNEVVHRDIKLENLLVRSSDKTLKLCDFGFARLMPMRSGILTDYVATRWYRSPELLLGEGHYGKEVDIWSIGCITGELIDAQPLFPGESEVDQLYLIQKMLGPLTAEQSEAFTQNQRYSGLKFPDMSRPTTIDQRYQGKMCKKAISFVKGTLVMDARYRLTAAEAVRHSWFEDVNSKDQRTQVRTPLALIGSQLIKPKVKGSTGEAGDTSEGENWVPTKRTTKQGGWARRTPPTLPPQLTPVSFPIRQHLRYHDMHN